MTVASLSLGAWLRFEFIAEYVQTHRPSRLIEFGPGLGAMGSRLSRAVDSYQAVEPDSESRRRAQSLLGNAVRASIEDLTTDEADMICAFEVLEHLENDAEALRQWVSRLRPGGRAIFSVPAFQEQFGPWDEIAGHLRRYSPDQLQRLMESAGLHVEEIRFTGFPLGFVLQFARNQVARRKRPAAGTAPDRTAASGRLLQTNRNGWITETISYPFRKMQRAPVRTGTGLVVTALKP